MTLLKVPWPVTACKWSVVKHQLHSLACSYILKEKSRWFLNFWCLKFLLDPLDVGSSVQRNFKRDIFWTRLGTVQLLLSSSFVCQLPFRANQECLRENLTPHCKAILCGPCSLGSPAHWWQYCGKMPPSLPFRNSVNLEVPLFWDEWDKATLHFPIPLLSPLAIRWRTLVCKPTAHTPAS